MDKKQINQRTLAGEMTRIKRMVVILLYKDLKLKKFANWSIGKLKIVLKTDTNVAIFLYSMIFLLYVIGLFGPYLLRNPR